MLYRNLEFKSDVHNPLYMQLELWCN